MFGKAKILIVAALLSGASPAESFLPVTNTVFTAFDVETTGFSPKNDRIVEIGAVRFRGNGEILAATNWLVNPGMPVPFRATQVHGITDGMLTNAPVFSAVWQDASSFLQGSILLAHNAAFDAGFLRAELERSGIPVPLLTIGDTLPLFRRWFPQARSHSLESLSAYLGLQNEGYHRAEADACYTIRIFNEGIKLRRTLTVDQLERDAGGFRRLNGGQH